MFQVICIGSASKDTFFPTGEGQFVDTPEDITAKQKVMFEVGAKYQVDDRYEAPGGVAANTAQGLARLGVRTACYSFIGDDGIGRWVTEELEREGVDTSLLHKVEESWTDLSAILVFTQTGERTIFFNRDANEKLVIRPDELKETEWFSVSALNGAWQDNLSAILALCDEHGIKLALNPGQSNMKDAVAAVLEAVRRASVLHLNKDEAIALVLGLDPDTPKKRLDDERALCERLHEAGARVIGLTDGKRGAWAFDGERFLHAKATVDKALDVTGAGDAFGSAFLAAWIRHGDIETALRWGVANGGNVSRSYGAKQGLIKETEMEDFVRSVKISG